MGMEGGGFGWIPQGDLLCSWRHQQKPDPFRPQPGASGHTHTSSPLLHETERRSQSGAAHEEARSRFGAVRYYRQ